MATVADVLAKKGNRVHCVAPRATVLAASHLMARHRIGALVVALTDSEGVPTPCQRVVGMFTERDVLTRIVGEERAPKSTLVEEVMSVNVAYCRPEMALEEVGAIMRERRIRHLPVCDDHGELKGLISIGDLNAWRAEGQAVEIMYLNEYIQGRV